MPARWAGFAAQLLGAARAPRCPGYASFGFHQVCEGGSRSRSPRSRCVAPHGGKPFAPSVFMLWLSFRRGSRARFQHLLFRNIWTRHPYAAGVLHTWCQDMRAAARALCVRNMSATVFAHVHVFSRLLLPFRFLRYNSASPQSVHFHYKYKNRNIAAHVGSLLCEHTVMSFQ